MDDNSENCKLPTIKTSQSLQVVQRRRFLNSAIIMETLPPNSKSNETIADVNQEPQQLQIKRCSCYHNLKNCSSHDFLESQQTISDEDCNSLEIDKKLSANSLNSTTSTQSSDTELQIQKWLLKKNQERRRKLLEEKLKLEQIEQEKQEKLALVETKVKEWLKGKQREQMETKILKQLKEEQEFELKQVAKERRRLASEFKYTVWCKKKEQLALEKKIEQQKALIAEMEGKKQKFIQNEAAFNDWLKNSRYKPKPVPLNQGLKSLYPSQTSFFNPQPWNPPV